ncbi:phosphatase PAP2 family protein [Bacteriovorax sp. PP10]|uniref:Phosphatase PAP2 family protein n=1 Tax=Bacteriovorax antarcticus TaxID=3088717 RepID=A0ABU5VSF4_9BACT|nr:phosphatase PAP2 family protein [Bacteriovorax sp. PP10]MEA9355984.1 phosphatase PAP2 family protein [Bacteriovorax sp. PP10]
MKFFSLLLFLSISGTAFGQFDFMDNGDQLGPYPVLDSVENKQEVEQMLYLQKVRTGADCAEAQVQATANLATLFGGKNGVLSDNEIAKVKKKLTMVTIKTGTEIYFSKSEFKRPRPYLTHPEIKPCVDLESSTAYPSGHSALARVYARMLSVIYPERSLQFFERADKAAFNRVLGGVHYPSDIVAGKKLGDVLADGYLSDSGLREELERLGR